MTPRLLAGETGWIIVSFTEEEQIHCQNQELSLINKNSLLILSRILVIHIKLLNRQWVWCSEEKSRVKEEVPQNEYGNHWLIGAI